MRLLILALLLVAIPAPAQADHGRPYPPNVRHARQWSRQHTTDRGWRCLDRLWHAESGWAAHSVTPKGASIMRGAFGLPQAYPGRKMIRAIGWAHRFDATRQARWGLRYIRLRYGSTCRARSFQLGWGYY